ncbi:MAG: hypothetical protein OES34_11735 [Nitrosopumilus sp.]|nr:hypothetical protein [Nitrosopumilus sp.]
MTSIESLFTRVENILKTSDDLTLLLPKLPSNVFQWIKEARPNLGKRKRNFDLFPYLIDIYEDNHPNIMSKWARQTFKTTTASDIMGCGATSNAGVELTYIADNNPHRSAFSKQRLRRETFQANPILKQFLPRGGQAAVEEINLNNDSVIYLTTDEGEYKNAEGKSNYLLVCDEFQYQDVQFLYKALYTLSQTHGRFYGFGIGGEQGSEYVNLWDRTDQREWIYDNPDWRSLLEFDSRGHITNNSLSLKGILSGNWVANRPENTQFRGYHIPQTIVPTIPLTIESAINDYHIQPQLSIEYQRRYFPKSIFLSHTMAEDYKAERRPITPEMIRSCMDPQLQLLTGNEVLELKALYGNKIRVVGGVDFGSSTATPTTVLSVNIHWRESHRYQIAHIEKIPQAEHPMDKARHIVEVFRSYGCDFSVGDWGHGQDMIPFIQDGGRDSHDIHFDGLNKSGFMGCRTIGDPTKPFSEYNEDVTDEGNTELSTITIDKTTTIQTFIDIFGQFVAHPVHPEDDTLKKPMYMIPGKNDYEIDFILKEWPKLTRVDLLENPEDEETNKKQNVKKEFSHPPDSLMSQIYTFVADNNYQDDAFKIIPVRRKRR